MQVKFRSMKKLMSTVFVRVLLLTRPILGWFAFRSPERLETLKSKYENYFWSSMVLEFNRWHDWIFLPFFRRVQYLETDIQKIQNLSGPTVFVIKNKGQLEYRYFNYLFLREKLSPVRFALGSLTLLWWPVRSIYEILLLKLSEFYKSRDCQVASESVAEDLGFEQHLLKGHNVLLSLTISRDYLFGLIRSNPLKVLEPLLSLQKQMEQPINIVPLQFLYDKHPDKSEASYFDLLFGEKSQPGAIRKILLFIMNYTRSPRVKFGEPIDLKAFIESCQQQAESAPCEQLFQTIEQSLRIEKARITGPRLQSKDALLKEIMHSTAFNQRLEQMALEQNRKPDDVKRDALRYLKEIAADVNYSYVQFFHVTLSYVWNTIYDGVVIKREQLNRVREIAGDNPVVLVPMHRSHMDYLLISDLFFGHNITFPYVCGGINLNFWPVGRLIRKGGGFFIRRTFDGNAAYKESLYAYMRSLLSSGHCIEFFIEGGRSRTGKMLKPKMGILSLILRAFAEGIERKDIYFVPIAVSYEQILEQKAYEQEKTGSEKSKENAGELLKVRKIFNKKYGKVYIEFAEPISLKSYVEERQIDLSIDKNNRQLVNEFAYHLTYHMNKAALVTPVTLVSLAILSLNDRTFTASQIIHRIEVLKDYLSFKKVEFSDLINYSSQYAYNEAIKTLITRGTLKEVETFEESFYMIEDRHRANLDYYKNNIAHFFVSLTCLCKVLNAQEQGVNVSLDTVIRQFELIKTLLRHDFTFSERNSTRDHILKVVEFLSERELVRYDADSGSIQKTIQQDSIHEFATYFSLLDNFFESHLIALRYFKHNQFQKLEKKLLMKEILTKGKPMYLKSDLKHPEALSQFNLENSFKVFVDLGIIIEERSDKQKTVLYSSTQEHDLVNKWIQSIQDYLSIKGMVLGRNVAAAASNEDGATVDWH